MNNNLLRYFAGYIDGDGCFRCNITTQKNGIVVYERSITVTSVKREPIDLFFDFFGGHTTEQQKGGNRRRTYSWCIKGDDAREVAIRIEPFLVIKNSQCSIFIDYCNSISHNKFRQVDESILNQRNQLISKIRDEIHNSDLIDREKIIDIKEIRNTIEPSKYDFPYLAGIIDSEGCFRISHRFRPRTNNKIYNTALEIGNTRASIIKWLAERFGGSISFTEKRDNRKSTSIWSIHSKSLKNILKDVFPFLVTKKEVAEELIRFQNTILKNGGKRSSESFKKEFQEICLHRERIIENIHKLNKKGL
jgi:hypothetical protein